MLAFPYPAQCKYESGLRDSLFDQLVGEEHGRLQIIQGQAGWKDDQIRGLSDAQRSCGGMWRAVENDKIVVIPLFYGLLHAAETLDGNHRLDSVLQAPRL